MTSTSFDKKMERTHFKLVVFFIFDLFSDIFNIRYVGMLEKYFFYCVFYLICFDVVNYIIRP